ncbi:hypothetical protein DHL47_03745 [Streptococcus panodentis]|uniref:Uncharacterized protein n=1 Tax=Streptococcus panodentis TaxID=1581472 RepID=A0ABS5AV53_9STRE|nr:hypothetical protein [Streptococcus panodentis]
MSAGFHQGEAGQKPSLLHLHEKKQMGTVVDGHLRSLFQRYRSLWIRAKAGLPVGLETEIFIEVVPAGVKGVLWSF